MTSNGNLPPPRYFSWIEKGRLAAFGWPSTAPNMEYLLSQGITHLVTLSPEKQPPIHFFPQIHWTLINIPEFDPPSIRQIEQFMTACEAAFRDKSAIGVHCRMGRGRTGTMLACYLVKYRMMKPEDAIDYIRTLRPGSVECHSQEIAVCDYYHYLATTRNNKKR